MKVMFSNVVETHPKQKRALVIIYVDKPSTGEIIVQ